MTDTLPQVESEMPAGEPVAAETPSHESSSTIETSMAKAFDDAKAKLDQRDEKRREIARSAKGQFSRKATVTSVTVEKPSVSPETAVPTVRQAPQSWPKEHHAEFSKLSPAAQELVERRERESHQKITELGQIAKSSEAFRQLGERYHETLRGRDPAQAFEQLLTAAHALERSPAESIKYLAQSYGVDLRQLVGEAPVAMHDPGALQTNEALIRDFASKQVYWPEIENEVLAQVNAIRATDPDLPAQMVLERAYDRALKLSDGVQAKLQAESRAKADQEAKAAAAKRAADAKRAGSVNVRSGQGISPRASGNWESTMREVGNRLMGS